MARTKNPSGLKKPTKSGITPEAIINQSQTNSKKRSQVQTKKPSKRLETLPPSESMLKRALSFPTKAMQDRYDMISKRDILRCRSIHIDTLNTLGIRKNVDDLIDQIGWKSFFQIDCPAFVELTREFYTTFSFDTADNLSAHTPGVIRYRLMGNQYEESLTDFNKSLGFISENDVHADWYINSKTGYGDWSCIDAWKDMSVDNHVYDPSQSSGALLKEPEWQYIHRFLSFNFVARKSGSATCSKLELYFIWAMANSVKLNLGYWLADQFRKVIDKNKGLIFGHVITHIAVKKKLVNLKNHSLHIAHDIIPIDLNTLKRMGIIGEEGDACVFRTHRPLSIKELRKQTQKSRVEDDNILDDAEDVDQSNPSCNFGDAVDKIQKLGQDFLKRYEEISTNLLERFEEISTDLKEKVNKLSKDVLDISAKLNKIAPDPSTMEGI